MAEIHPHRTKLARIGICGLGNIGSVHLENLLSLRGCELCSLFDADPSRLAKYAAEHEIRAAESYAEFLETEDMDAVLVATPAETHADLAIPALRAGKHVFVEKPLAASISDARQIAEAARKAGRILQTGFCERFNAHYLEVKRAVRSGEIGAVRAIHTTRESPLRLSDPAWELGVLDTAIHNYDLIAWLLERAPESVLARGAAIYPGSTRPETVATWLQFPNGIFATDRITWLSDDSHPLTICARSRMSVLGERGSIEVDLSSRPVSITTPEGHRQVDTVIIGAGDYYSGLRLQFDAFLKSLEDGREAVPPEESILAERIAIAAARSLDSGRETRLEEIT